MLTNLQGFLTFNQTKKKRWGDIKMETGAWGQWRWWTVLVPTVDDRFNLWRKWRKVQKNKCVLTICINVCLWPSKSITMIRSNNTIRRIHFLQKMMLFSRDKLYFLVLLLLGGLWCGENCTYGPWFFFDMFIADLTFYWKSTFSF